MKNLTTILIAVLFVAIAGLYLLFFIGKSSGKTNAEGNKMSTTSAEGLAYVNIDTVIFKFDMFFDRREDLMAKQKDAEAQLNSKGTQYQKNAKDYQDKVSKGLVTRATAAEMEQSLVQQEQELVNLQNSLQNNLLEEEQVMNRQIIDYITKYLEENKSEFNVQFVLGKSFGSVVLYGDSALDITQKVLDALNKKYQAEKK